jgi:hypothetical protein
MKRTVIVLIVMVAAIAGGAIGYYWSSYERSVFPVVEDVFEVGRSRVRKVNLMQNRGQYVYSLIARIEPLDVGGADGANARAKGVTEKVLNEELRGGRGDMVSTDLVMAVRLLFDKIPKSGEPSLAVDTVEHFTMKNGSEGNSTVEARLPVPPETWRVYFESAAHHCKWEGDRMVVFELSIRDLEKKRRLMNIDLILVRKEAG